MKHEAQSLIPMCFNFWQLIWLQWIYKFMLWFSKYCSELGNPKNFQDTVWLVNNFRGIGLCYANYLWFSKLLQNLSGREGAKTSDILVIFLPKKVHILTNCNPRQIKSTFVKINILATLLQFFLFPIFCFVLLVLFCFFGLFVCLFIVVVVFFWFCHKSS